MVYSEGDPMKYLRITRDAADQRPQIKQILTANGATLEATEWLVPESHPDISFVLLNLQMIDQVEWVTDKRIKTQDNAIRAFV